MSGAVEKKKKQQSYTRNVSKMPAVPIVGRLRLAGLHSKILSLKCKNIVVWSFNWVSCNQRGKRADTGESEGRALN